MPSQCALVLFLFAAQAHAADFSFSLIGESRALTDAAITSPGAVERCVGSLQGPVVALLFKGHDRLVVDVHAAPKGTDKCIKQVLLALDVSKAAAHESIMVVAGNATGPGEWPTSGLEVSDPDAQPANPFSKPVKSNATEARAHAPLFRRCSKGEHEVTISTGSDGSVTEATGTKDACVLEVLKGMQFAAKHRSFRLNLRLD